MCIDTFFKKNFFSKKKCYRDFWVTEKNMSGLQVCFFKVVIDCMVFNMTFFFFSMSRCYRDFGITQKNVQALWVCIFCVFNI